VVIAAMTAANCRSVMVTTYLLEIDPAFLFLVAQLHHYSQRKGRRKKKKKKKKRSKRLATPSKEGLPPPSPYFRS
jgi:hypothetical protein